MKRKNRKGFTLVELLVAISIMGLILVMAIPSIRNLQNSNRETKYEKYGDSILSGTKLYIDSYGKDEFGNAATGCVDIPYSLLKKKNLVKDIKVDNTVCTSKDADNQEITFVRVRKANDQYSYELSIKCTRNGAVVYDKTLDPKGCGTSGPDREGPKIEFTPNGTSNYVQKIPTADNTATILIHDEYGLNKNIKIKYAWTQDPNGNVAASEFKEHSFGNNAGLKIGSTDNSSTWLQKKVPAPEVSGNPVSGTYYLVVQPVDVRDFVGNPKTTKVISAPFKFDNTKPVITSKTNSLQAGKWTNQNVVMTFTAADKPDGAHQSGIEKIVYAYKSNPTASELLEDWTGGSGASVEGTWTAQREQEVFVFAIDKSGNMSDAVSAGWVRIDKTPPTVSISKSGTMGKDGWYVSIVTVNSTTNDEGGSGVESYGLTTSATPTYNSKKTGTQATVFSPGIKWYAYVKDAAGNTASTSTEQFIVIANPPTISFSLSGSTSTAKCYDGNTGAYIDTWTKSVGNSTHTVTCTDQYGLSTTCSQSYKKETHTSTGEYSCACTGCCGTCRTNPKISWCHCCCSNCGSSTYTVVSKSGGKTCS